MIQTRRRLFFLPTLSRVVNPKLQCLDFGGTLVKVLVNTLKMSLRVIYIGLSQRFISH